MSEGIVVKIGICDDQQLSRKAVKEFLIHYLSEKTFEYQIFEYESGEKLLENAKSLDVLLLDIHLGKSDGIKIKEKVQEENMDVKIVFVTGFYYHIEEAFGKNVYGFLEKPLVKEKFNKIMDCVFDEGKSLPVEVNNKEVKYINLKSILYIKAEGNYTSVVTQDKEFIERKTMIEWERILDKAEFFRTHNSFIVNLNHVKYNPSGKYILSNGEKIMISRYKLNAFKECYNNFLKKKNKF